MEEFTVSLLYKILFIAFAIVFGSLDLNFLVGNHLNYGFGVSMVIISLPTIMVLLLISRLVRKVMISADSIISTRLFGRKELSTSNIKGFRIKKTRIIIEPSSPTTPKMVIYAFDQLVNYEDLIKWLRENFIDLDMKDKNKTG